MKKKTDKEKKDDAALIYNIKAQNGIPKQNNRIVSYMNWNIGE